MRMLASLETSSQAVNVDEVLDCHTDFLRQSLQDCLLTSTDLLRILSKLLMLCVAYSNFMLVSDIDQKFASVFSRIEHWRTCLQWKKRCIVRCFMLVNI